MTVSLTRWSVGDTDYVDTYNRNMSVLESIVNILQGASPGTTVNLVNLYRALYGETATVIDNTGLLAVLDQAVDGLAPSGVILTAGYAWIPSVGGICRNTATTLCEMTVLGNGTYYISLDILGTPVYSDVLSNDALYSVVKSAGVYSDLIKLSNDGVSGSLVERGLCFQFDLTQNSEELNVLVEIADVSLPHSLTQYRCRLITNLHYGDGGTSADDEAGAFEFTVTFKKTDAGVISLVDAIVPISEVHTAGDTSDYTVTTDGATVTFKVKPGAVLDPGQSRDYRLMIEAVSINSSWVAP